MEDGFGPKIILATAPPSTSVSPLNLINCHELQTTYIFLVDDQIAILNSGTRLLTAADFDVETFESAQEFLDSGNIDMGGGIVLDLATRR